MLYLLIIISLAGIGITLLKSYLRGQDDETEEAREVEHHPVAHIKSMLFLDIPLEKIVMGYFAVTALVYAGLLITGAVLPELDLAVLLLSGIVILLLIYNLVMVIGIAERFNWRVFLLLVLSAVIFSIVLYRPDVVSTELLQQAIPYTTTAHILGVVLGLGGAIILDMMIFHFLKNFRISKREAVIMHLLSQMIVLGLILIIVSGISLMFTDLESYLENPRFMMKMTAVIIVILNGIVLNLYVTPKMELISLREEDRKSNRRLVTVSFIVGAISGISWFSVFFLAMINDLERFSYNILLIAYLVLLSITIGVGLLTRRSYEESAKNEEM